MSQENGIDDNKTEEMLAASVFNEVKSKIMSMSWDEAEKETVIAELKKVYKATLNDIITMSGLTLKKVEEDGNENGQINECQLKKRKVYLQMKLIPEVHEAVVELTRQRQVYPLKCAKELATQCSQECSSQKRIKFDVPATELSCPEAEGQNIAPNSSTQWRQVQENIQIQSQHANELLAALNIAPFCKF